MFDRPHQNNLLHLSVDDDVDGIKLIQAREELSFAVLIQEPFQPRQIVFLQRSETVLQLFLVSLTFSELIHNLFDGRCQHISNPLAIVLSIECFLRKHNFFDVWLDPR